MLSGNSMEKGKFRSYPQTSKNIFKNNLLECRRAAPSIGGGSMKMTSCPKYLRCNAPICPLDDNWQKRTCLAEDSTCYYLLESVKRGSKTHFQVAQLGELYERVVKVRGAIAKHFKRIASKLSLAKKTSSRMSKKLNKQGGEV